MLHFPIFDFFLFLFFQFWNIWKTETGHFQTIFITFLDNLF